MGFRGSRVQIPASRPVSQPYDAMTPASSGVQQSWAVVSGASSGIGAATARVLARQGWQLLLLGRDPDRLESLRAELGGESETMAEDLVTGTRLESCAQEFLDRRGPVTALIAAHGIAHVGPALTLSRQTLENTLSVNLTSTVRLLQAFLPSMLECNRGTVVAVLSVAARHPFPGWGAYCASKAGLLAWLQCLRQEVQGRGVRITALFPGATATPLWDGLDGDWDQSRMLTPETVANSIAWILGQGISAEVEELSLRPPWGNL